MGITIVGEIPLSPEEEDFCVWPENWETFIMFIRLGTQWNVAGMGGISGLNYPGVWTLLDRYLHKNTIEERLEMFEDLQAMERAALKVLNKKAA
jgi:hypothetical protein